MARFSVARPVILAGRPDGTTQGGIVTVATQGLTPAQERVLALNFQRSGPLYLGQDLHPMLDCACAPERVSQSMAPAAVSMDNPLVVPFNGKLREEFFGGILFDCDSHQHYMVDQTAYQILREVTCGEVTGRQVADRIGSPEPVMDTIGALASAGLLATGRSGGSLSQFPARDLSLAYLQAPIIVEVEVTYGCFRACKHCAYESSPDARRPDELTAAQWRDVFAKLADAGVLIIQLTGGDPLFREDSFDIVQAASDLGMSVYVRSDTAALSPANVERLQALPGLWHVGTSMDGADADMHDWMRGRGAFATLTKRVEILAAAGITVSVGATLHKQNYTSVRRMGQVAAGLGARWFDIGFLSPVGRGVQLCDLVLDRVEVEAALTDYLAGIEAGEYTPQHTHYRRRVGREDPFADLGDLIERIPYLTEWPFSRLRLDPTGSSYTAGKLKGSDYAGGFNLVDTTVAHVWDHSPNLAQLRELGDSRRIHSLDYRLLRANHEFM
jgi:MoaA/NifB/PqqE/SkfB family radical SAM enzyme